MLSTRHAILYVVAVIVIGVILAHHFYGTHPKDLTPDNQSTLRIER